MMETFSQDAQNLDGHIMRQQYDIIFIITTNGKNRIGGLNRMSLRISGLRMTGIRIL